MVENKLRSINIMKDLRKLLMEGEVLQESVIESYYVTPEIEVVINDKKFKILIDTGSDVTCMSESIFQQHIDLWKKCSVLPTKQFNLITAGGKKTAKITKQILINMNINNNKITGNFLIVPKLVTDFLFGNDILSEYKVQIDYEKQLVIFHINEQVHTISFITKTNIPVCGTLQTTEHNYYQQSDNVNNNLNITEEINNVINTIHNLTLTQRQTVRNLLMKYQSVFSDRPGKCNVYKSTIELNNPQPYIRRTYPIPLNWRNEVDHEIQNMIYMDIIEPYRTEYINPMVVVKKKNGIRLCLDARILNEYTIPDHDCNEPPDILLQKCYGTKFRSNIDLTASFWQLELEEGIRKYTGFLYKNQTYVYKRTPFGLKNSLASLVRAMRLVLDEQFQEFTIIFVDDIMCISKTFEEHIEHLSKIFNRIQECGMTINLTKSQFFKDEAKFLGFIFNNQGIQPDPMKIESIKNFPRPKNQKELKGFLGLCQFYSRFIRNYSTTIQPLLHLTGKKEKFIWTSKEQIAFQETKNRFLDCVMLEYPDIKRTYILQTDASSIAIAGYLYQINDEGEQQVLAFLSRVLHGYECAYCTTELELLAIIWCLQKIRTFVVGSKLIIKTDHQALIHIQKSKQLNGRLTRWMLLLQEYDFKIEYCTGKENVIADILSRQIQDNPEISIHSNIPEFHTFRIMHKVNEHINAQLMNLNNLQKDDHKIALIRFQLLKSIRTDEINNKYKVENELVMKKCRNEWKILIPDVLIKKLTWTCHQYHVHVGSQQCYKILRESFTWNKMYRTIRQTLETCKVCQTCKHPNKRLHADMKPIIVNKPRELVSVDLLGPFPRAKGGMKYLFVVVDIFTKYIQVYPIRQPTARTVTNIIIQKYINEYGPIERILSDHGSQFTSNIWKNTLTDNNIKINYSSIRHPQSNPVERYNREINRILRTYCQNKHTKWIECLELVNTYLNQHYNEATGYTPVELFLQQKPIRFWSEIVPNSKIDLKYEEKLILAGRNTERKAEQRVKRHNIKYKMTRFQIGDQVLVKALNLPSSINAEMSKLFSIYRGPFCVNKIFNEVTYELIDIDKNIVGNYHTELLKKYYKPQDKEANEI